MPGLLHSTCRGTAADRHERANPLNLQTPPISDCRMPNEICLLPPRALLILQSCDCMGTCDTITRHRFKYAEKVIDMNQVLINSL